MATPIRVAPKRRAVDLVAIGLSTGGPQALRLVVPQLPPDFPVPIAVVLHMPVGYTQLYAYRLNEVSMMDVVEARDGGKLRAGRLTLACAGRHLRVVRGGNGALRAALSLEPTALPHRPSVDVLFESAAEACGSRVLGIVLTGMGNDGLEGARRIKERGGRIVTEAESSCVVYGMPRSVEEAGLSDHVVSLGDLPTLLAELI